MVPMNRVRLVRDTPVRGDGEFVLYWMHATRRCRFNFALERALHWAHATSKPLVVLETLPITYPWASDRLHAFTLQGMHDNAARFATTEVTYYPYVEPTPGEGVDLPSALAEHAAVVVTDDVPAFLRRPHGNVEPRMRPRVEAVDSNGLVPLGVPERPYPTAYSFRRLLHRELGDHLAESPLVEPLSDLGLPSLGKVPPAIAARWPAATPELLAATPTALTALPIDHEVGVAPQRGGARAGAIALDHFLTSRLSRYARDRNVPDEDATSELSPYLRAGHIGAHDVFWRVAEWAEWAPDQLRPEDRGSRSGWGMQEGGADFVDQLVTWRELGYNMCQHRHDYVDFSSLPTWARDTLSDHADDPRPHLYTLEELAGGHTHDRLWNAAQTQLRTEGRLHNYLRMLWAKKVLEWSESPEVALDVLITLNDRFALDGQDPNSYSGILWTFGRYDRPWGPERPIFGKVRYMSSKNTARKVRVNRYLERYAPAHRPGAPSVVD